MIDYNRYSRQFDLANPDDLQMPISIIGAGGIGSWTALALAKMGCFNLDVFDPDIIESGNLGSQIYSERDIDRPKITALIEYLTQMTEFTVTDQVALQLEIDVDNVAMFANSEIVIMAVDSITVRKMVFDALKGQEKWLIDGRMAGNAIELFCLRLDNPYQVAEYEKTFFSAEDALNIPCSSRAVIYNTFVIGGLIADMVAQISRRENPPREIIVDLLNFRMETTY